MAANNCLKPTRMKVIFLLAVNIMLISSVLAQTKRIAHRSHSGSQSNFNLKGDGNWGGPPLEYRKKVVLKPVMPDTIKVKSFRRKDSLPPRVNPAYTRKSVIKSNKGKR
jgi:hypothetical protein